MAAFVVARLHHWVDPATIAVCMAYTVWKWLSSKPRHRLTDPRTGRYAFTGITIFPLVLIIGASISHYVAEQFMTTNRVLLFVVGIVALLAVLEDGSGRS